MREQEAESSESDSEDDSDSEGEGATELNTNIEGDWMDQEDVGFKQQSFDIYIKGHATKTSTFFKTTDIGAPRYRMFPFVEKKRRFDDFGEIIDVSAWLRKGKILDAKVESDESKAADLKKVEEQKKVWNKKKLGLPFQSTEPNRRNLKRRPPNLLRHK